MIVRFLRFRYLAIIYLAIPFCWGEVAAQQRVNCPDGDHIKIDVNQLSIKYSGSSFAATLSSLAVFSSHFTVESKQLQQVAVATQQWNEFLKGLAEGYNACAVTRQQYAEGLSRIYPRLTSDAKDLEAVRETVAKGIPPDQIRFEQLLRSFRKDLSKFAEISGKSVLLERIQAISDQIATADAEIGGQQKADTEQIEQRLSHIEDILKQDRVPKPVKVRTDLENKLYAKADDADAAYKHGYDLLNRFRFAEAIPYFRTALEDVPLPDFYDALAQAYYLNEELPKAEQTLLAGFGSISNDKKTESQFNFNIALVLRDEGNLNTALDHARRALELGTKTTRDDELARADDLNLIGLILKGQGWLNDALASISQALDINQRLGDDTNAAVNSSNIAQIFLLMGDTSRATQFAQRALDSQIRVFGSRSSQVAIDLGNFGGIYLTSKMYDRALGYFRQAYEIDLDVYGPNHPAVARDLNEIGQALQGLHRLDEAAGAARRALAIDEQVYGERNPVVAKRMNNLGDILADQGKLPEALSYSMSALEIDRNILGPDNPDSAKITANIGNLLYAQGKFDDALDYERDALTSIKNNPNVDPAFIKEVESSIAAIEQKVR